ncbi:phosphatase PAP2 family protein [Ferruginibacter lapsinanis]|uniref:phosphatase PAP2 family protein n=1 Tax=Ferruginibacter lapsinanis TaxID=563172 RepID=UPI001E2AFB31|nr:phosphatase PAP2 family protein [Ferruginibacter lapsinanis]UEG50359.1 phosphatase PAP2 family protein [Ferruginibacter lapsinanis]
MYFKEKIIVIVSLLFCAINTNAQNIDIDLLKPINKHETDFKNKYLELCASSVTATSMALPVGVFAAGLIKHDKKLQINAAYMMGAYLTSAIITQGTKRIFDRNRPFQDYAFIVKRDDESGGMSFPSGHTSAAFSTATSLSLYYPKWYVIAPAYLYAASVGWARMYQGVHYPTDVLGGAIVGAGSAWLSYKVHQHIDKKNLAKKKSAINKATL